MGRIARLWLALQVGWSCLRLWLTWRRDWARLAAEGLLSPLPLNPAEDSRSFHSASSNVGARFLLRLWRCSRVGLWASERRTPGFWESAQWILSGILLWALTPEKKPSPDGGALTLRLWVRDTWRNLKSAFRRSAARRRKVRDDAELIQITGMTQCGKSTLLRSLIQSRPRVLIVSPFRVAWPGVEQFDTIGQAVEAFRNFQGKTFRAAVRCWTPEDFDWACQLAWTLAPCSLVLDETTLYLPNPSAAPMSFKLICQAWAHAGDDHGEKRQVSVIAVGQRPYNLPPIFRAEVKVWYLFRLNARGDRKLLEDDFGLTREQSDRSGKLAPYSFMRVDRFAEVTHGRTTI